jgi:hypothetical protein
MAKFARPINSFVAGELSPRFYGRTDANQYQQGCRELTNFVVRAQGGARRRMGSLFVSDGFYTSFGVKTAFPTAVRSIKFQFSRTDQAIVVLSTTNAFNTYGVQIYIPSSKTWVSPTVTLSTNFAQFAAWTTQAELEEVQYAQSGDVMVLVSQKNPPMYIRRNSLVANGWEMVDIYGLREQTTPVFENTRQPIYAGSDTAIQQKVSGSAAPGSGAQYLNVPYAIQSSRGTVNPSATTGTVSLTFSSYKPTDLIGTIVRATKTGVTGYAVVTSVVGFVATAVVLKAFGATGVQDSWEWQDFGTGTNGWPKAVCFHDQRLWFANSTNKPNTLWASQVGDYTELMITRSADDAKFATLSNDRPFSYNLASNEINDIEWMVSGKSSIFIGTLGDEWIGSSGSDNIIGPLFPNFTPQTNYGSKNLQSININGSVIFCEKSGGRLREFIFNNDEQAYRAVDLCYFADHLVRKGLEIYSTYNAPEIKALAVQSGSDNCVWMVDSNGGLHVLSREREYGTLAWSSMVFGGVNDVAGAQPQVKSVCVIANNGGTDQDVYVMVQRYISGQTVVYFERILPEFLGPSLQVSSNDVDNHPIYADSAVLLMQLTSPKFLAKYDSSANADYYAGLAAATTSGSPTVSSGLVLTGGTVKYASYDSANVPLVQTGTIYLEVTPNYSGSPVANRHFFSISKTNADQANLINLMHRTDGALIITLKDSAGATITGGTSTTWVPVLGQKYKFYITFDATLGKLQFTINGQVPAGTGTMPTATRSSSIANFVIGSDYTKTATAQFTINKFAASSAYLPLPLNSHPTGYILDKTILGVSHLGTGVCDIMGDGQFISAALTPTSDLPSALTGYGILGLNFRSRLSTMPLEMGSILGSAQGAMKRVHEVTLRFERTVGATFGPDGGQFMDDVNFQDTTYVSGPIPLYTGDKQYKFPLGYSRDYSIAVQQDLPMPCNVTAIFPTGLTYD